MTFAVWEAATECTGGPTPGARALMAGCLGAYGDHGAFSLGIYNCRNVRSTSTRSCHAEGRACDVGFPVVAGRASAAGQDLVDRLRPEAAGLGIQAMIYDRVIYSRRSPEGRPYGGASPHLDHVHIELTRLGGRELTLATVQAVLGDGSAELPATDDVREPMHVEEPADVRRPADTRDPDPVTDPWQTGATALPELRRGSRGRFVAQLQELLGLHADGIFGARTEKAVRGFQSEQALTVDGVVGALTWGRLLALSAQLR